MRLTLELQKREALPGISLSFLKEIVRETCEKAFPKVFRKSLFVSLDVASVSEKEIQRLNKKYRRKNAPTDILSFGPFSSPEETRSFKGKKLDLGEIILSPDFIRRGAKEDGVSWKHEFIFVFSHGILHLLGYDHSKEMFHLQDALTEKMIQ